MRGTGGERFDGGLSAFLFLDLGHIQGLDKRAAWEGSASNGCGAMAIKGEVHVRNLLCHPIASFHQGRYVIRPFECKITGKAKGCARVKASIHTILTSIDDEEWRIITLMVEHLDSQLLYTDLFAPSCGSIGDFTDIKKYGEGYVVPPQMRDYNFSVRNFDGAFYDQVYPFDPFYFCTRCIRQGLFCLPPIIRSLHCCNMYASNLNMLKSLFSFSRIFRDTGLRMTAP